MKPLLCFVAAAFLEIAGCYSVWAWQRLQKSPLWLVPGVVSLLGFAWLLTRVDASFAGRAYAAYGGVYVASSLVWLWAVEKAAPDRYDLAGAGLCLLGTLVILLAPRAAV
ncbi:MAG TPA: YnfA family protein [Prosthecobacter sp.]